MAQAAAAMLERQQTDDNRTRARFIAAFAAVRAETERRCAQLSPEDQTIQSMPDASPPNGTARTRPGSSSSSC